MARTIPIALTVAVLLAAAPGMLQAQWVWENPPSVPEANVPEANVPEASVPEASVPEASVPEANSVYSDIMYADSIASSIQPDIAGLNMLFQTAIPVSAVIKLEKAKSPVPKRRNAKEKSGTTDRQAAEHKVNKEQLWETEFMVEQSYDQPAELSEQLGAPDFMVGQSYDQPAEQDPLTKTVAINNR